VEVGTMGSTTGRRPRACRAVGVLALGVLALATAALRVTAGERPPPASVWPQDVRAAFERARVDGRLVLVYVSEPPAT
jgi:hypothetical protein